MLAILAAAFLASWVLQGLTYGIVRETLPPAGARNLVERKLPISRHERLAVQVTRGQNLLLLTVQITHGLLGLTTTVVFLAVVWTFEAPKSRAQKTIKPLSLDSPAGRDQTPGP